MKITVVVDANPIISALIGGASMGVLFDRRLRFVTTGFTLSEVEKYLPTISRKSGVSEHRIKLALALLPITAYTKETYTGSTQKAEMLIGGKDSKDVEILALALELKAPLWSEDKHFEDITGITLLKTKDLV